MTIIAWSYIIIYDIRNASGLPSLRTRQGFTSIDTLERKVPQTLPPPDRPLINDQPRPDEVNRSPVRLPVRWRDHRGTTVWMRAADPLDRSPRDKRSSCISDTAVISDGETERITIANRFWCTINRASPPYLLCRFYLRIFPQNRDRSRLCNKRVNQIEQYQRVTRIGISFAVYAEAKAIVSVLPALG